MDGPAAGQNVGMLRRAPRWLRVVYDEEAGTWDALDQLTDEPARSEVVYVYELAGPPVEAFVRPGGRIQIGHYKHVPTMPEDKVRDNDDWHRWVEERTGDKCDPETGLPLRALQKVPPVT